MLSMVAMVFGMLLFSVKNFLSCFYVGMEIYLLFFKVNRVISENKFC